MAYDFEKGLAFIRELDKITEKRIAEILCTEGGVEVSGNRYYMSCDGDDGNDGRSPERAWKTIWKLRTETEKLREGDGKVDLSDFVRVIRGFDSTSTASYKKTVDIDESGAITVTDLGYIKASFDKTAQDYNA